MNIEIPFTKKRDGRFIGFLRLEIKDKSLINEFESEMKNYGLACSDFPSVDGKKRFFIEFFQDEFNDIKSKGLMEVISNYAKEIIITF